MKTLAASFVGMLLTFAPASVWSDRVPAWIERLGWTLVHSVWQLSAVAVIAATVDRALRRHSADARYVVGVTALGLMLALPCVTWTLVAVEPRSGQVEMVTAPNVAPPRDVSPIEQPTDEELSPHPARRVGSRDFARLQPDAASSRAESREPPGQAQWGEGQHQSSPRMLEWIRAAIEPRLPWLVALWIAGVVLCSLRPAWGLWTQWRLQRVGLSPVSESVQHLLLDLARRMRLARVVRIAASAFVRVPMVVGYLRPMILLPACVLTGLTPTQLEAVLAHELAHVRRHDWLINALQVLAETLLFYHPAVWWLSNRVRHERELCCDDFALSLIGDKAVFARTLLILEELRQSAFTPALAATGGDLAHRVRRLLPTPHASRHPNHGSGATVLVTLCLSLALLFGVFVSSRAEVETPPTERSELEKLHGAWELVSFTSDGVKKLATEKDTPFEGQRIWLANGRWTEWFTGEDAPPKSDEHKIEFPFRTDATAKPKSFDYGPVRANGQPETWRKVGIYRIENDLLTVCFRVEAMDGPPAKRPDQFAAPVGSFAGLAVYRRLPAGRAERPHPDQFAPPSGEVVRGLDLSQKRVRGYWDALRLTPDLHVPDPRNPDAWTQPKNVFQMPLAEHTWLKYPAGSGHFYIEHRPDGSPEGELLYGPIEGDPFEVLKLDDFFREKLKPDSYIVGSDPRYRLRLMFRTAEPSLMQRAWQFIEPVLSRKFSNRNEPGFFERLEILEIARDGLREQVAANKSAELVDLGQRMRDVIGAAEASVDAINDSVPDASYQPATYLQPKIQAQLPDALWGKPVSGLRLGLVPRESGPDSEWDALPADASLPTTIKAKPGEPLHYLLMVENVSDAEIKFCGYVGGEEMARSVEILDHKGQPARIDSLHTDIPHFINHWRLKPHERMLLTIPAIHFRPVSPDSPTKGLGYHVTAANGRYSLRCSYHFGDLDTSRQRHIPGKTEWIGQLTTGTQTITVGTGKDDDATANAAATAPPDGLEFLKPYPKLHGLSLDMTEPQFLEIVTKQGMKTLKLVNGVKVTHHLVLGDGHMLIVKFGKNAKCSGIQRVRGEDAALVPPEIVRFANKGRSAVSVQTEDDVRFMLYSHDFLQTGLSKTVLDTGEWRIEGHVNLLKDGREVRRFAVKYTSQEPHTLYLDGKPIVMDRLPKPDNTDGCRDPGRLFFLRGEGETVQTGCTSALKNESDLDPERKWSLAYYVERNLIEEEANRINRKLFEIDGWVIASDSQHPTQHGSGTRVAHLRVFPDGRVVMAAKDGRGLVESRVPRDEVAAFVNWAIDHGGAGPRKASAVVLYRGNVVPIFVDPLPSSLWDQHGSRIAINRDGKTYDLLSIEPLRPEREDPAILRNTAGALTDEARDRLQKLLALAKPAEKAPDTKPGDQQPQNANQSSPREGLEFLKPYPKLHGLSLDMTEPQFLEIVQRQELKTRKTVDGEKVTHHFALGDGHTLIVMFDKDAKCSGIQRVRGEDKLGELEPFQGTWAMDLCDSETKDFGGSQAVVKNWRWAINGNEIVWSRSKDEVWKLTFVVDLTRSPKEIDLTFLDGPHKGEKCLGMYEWDGVNKKMLLMSVQDPGAKVERPKSISMKGGGQTSLIFLEPMNAEKELASLQGTWKFEIIQTDGWPKPIGKGPDRLGRGDDRQWGIKGNEIAWISPDGDEVKLSFTIDPTKSPKHFDVTFLSGPHKGQKCLGIYERGGLGGVVLWLCLTDPGSQAPRPTKVSYSTNEGRTMIGLYRVEQPEKPAEKPADSGVQVIPPLLEFRFAAQPPDSKLEPRVPADFEKRTYPHNTAIGRMIVEDKGFVWVGVFESEEVIPALPVERPLKSQVREALLADTPEHTLPFNGKWSVEECRVVPDPNGGGRFGIELKLNEAGGAALRTLTKSHLNQPLAILVNNKIIAAPLVRSEIGGDIAITGNFTREQADRLAKALSLRPQAAPGF